MLCIFSLLSFNLHQSFISCVCVYENQTHILERLICMSMSDAFYRWKQLCSNTFIYICTKRDYFVVLPHSLPQWNVTAGRSLRFTMGLSSRTRAIKPHGHITWVFSRRKGFSYVMITFICDTKECNVYLAGQVFLKSSNVISYFGLLKAFIPKAGTKFFLRVIADMVFDSDFDSFIVIDRKTPRLE